MLYWARDMACMRADSEDTVLYLLDHYVAAAGIAPGSDGQRALRDAVRMCQLSEVYYTCMLPHMPWAKLSPGEFLACHEWRASGPELRAAAGAAGGYGASCGWMLPARGSGGAGGDGTAAPRWPELRFTEQQLEVGMGHGGHMTGCTRADACIASEHGHGTGHAPLAQSRLICTV